MTDCEEDPGYISGGQLTSTEITSALNTLNYGKYPEMILLQINT